MLHAACTCQCGPCVGTVPPGCPHARDPFQHVRSLRQCRVLILWARAMPLFKAVIGQRNLGMASITLRRLGQNARDCWLLMEDRFRLSNVCPVPMYRALVPRNPCCCPVVKNAFFQACLDFAPPPAAFGARGKLASHGQREGTSTQRGKGAVDMKLHESIASDSSVFSDGDLGVDGKGRWRASLAESGRVSACPKM